MALSPLLHVKKLKDSEGDMTWGWAERGNPSASMPGLQCRLVSVPVLIPWKEVSHSGHWGLDNEPRCESQSQAGLTPSQSWLRTISLKDCTHYARSPEPHLDVPGQLSVVLYLLRHEHIHTHSLWTEPHSPDHGVFKDHQRTLQDHVVVSCRVLFSFPPTPPSVQIK